MSGEPNVHTTITIGSVPQIVIKSRTTLAANFPMTNSISLIGKVNKKSSVPERFSSAQERMLIAGTKNKRTQGAKSKKGLMVACPIKKNDLKKYQFIKMINVII